MTNQRSNRGWAAIEVSTTRADQMLSPEERQQIEAVVAGDPIARLEVRLFGWEKGLAELELSYRQDIVHPTDKDVPYSFDELLDRLKEELAYGLERLRQGYRLADR